MSISTPYDPKIQKLKSRIQAKPGPNPHLKQKLQNQKARQFSFKQDTRISNLKTKAKDFNKEQKATPDVTPQMDPGYLMAQASGQNIATQGLADIEAQRSTFQADYGSMASQLQADYAASREALAAQRSGLGDRHNFNVRGIERNFDVNKRTTGNAYARSGQLYAGSLNNARDIDKYNYDRSMEGEGLDFRLAMEALARQEADLGRQETAAKTALSREQRDFLNSLSIEERDIAQQYGFYDPSGNWVPGMNEIEAYGTAITNALNAPLPPPQANPFKAKIQDIKAKSDPNAALKAKIQQAKDAGKDKRVDVLKARLKKRK